MRPPIPAPSTGVALRAEASTSESDELWAGRLGAVDGDRLTVILQSVPQPDRLRAISEASELEMNWKGEGGDEYALPVSLVSLEPRSGQATLEVCERRNHMRVGSSLIFRHRLLSDAEYAALAPRILSQPLEYLEDSIEADRVNRTGDETWERLDAVLANFHQMLRAISDQVEHLTALQEGRETPRRLDRSSRVVNISGAGLAFESVEPIPVGAKLRMAFDLSRYPYREIICLGQAVRTSTHPAPPPDTPPHTVSVTFTHIREEDRDRIIHYVFKMQRRMLRRRRDQEQ